MPLKYHVVERPDMRKDAQEGSTLFYGQVRANGRIKLNLLCDLVAGYTSANRADVLCIIQGLVFHMKTHLMHGHLINLGDFGSFRMIAGSKGVEEEKKFHPALFKRPKIVFTPGLMLKDTPDLIRFEKETFKEVPENCTQEHAM